MTPAPAPANAPGSVSIPAELQKALRLINQHRKDGSAGPGERETEGEVTLAGPLSAGGRSNHSFLVRAGAETLVLRLDGVDPARNAIHRDTEFRLHAAAAAAGLAPTPRFHDASAGVLLVDYIAPDVLPQALTDEVSDSPGDMPPGISRHTQQDRITTAQHTTDVADLLRAIHALRVADAPRLSLEARIAHYETQVRRCRSPATANLMQMIAKELTSAGQALDADATTGVICHNDLGSANRLYHGGRLYALDWEYAACGSRWFDLAVASDGQITAPALLRAYLRRSPTAQESALLAESQRVARYLELLWLACNTTFTEQQLQDGLRDLGASLAEATPPERHRAD